jgi:pimeloyl-ACP methyl ester carboxylesterase
MDAVTPFRIAVPDEVLDDLRARLDRTRLPGTDVPGAGWDLGTDPGLMDQLLAHWRDGFDWRAAEASLNRLPQFSVPVRGTPLHFVHARGRGVEGGPAPLPLLFSHGWPGSFWEVHKIIGPLTDPAAHGGDPADAFDVVAPSLPGYTFSADPQVPGVHPGEIAERFAELMSEVLGYPRFGLQGGDWGSIITSRLAHAHPERVTGLHLNMAGLRPNTGPGTPPLSEAEAEFLAAMRRWGWRRPGTRPSRAAGRAPSPTG